MSQIKDMIEQINDINEEKGWNENNPSFCEKLVLAHAELSEALEAYRIDDWYHVEESGKPEGVVVELADAVIRIFHMAKLFDLDLEAALVEKIEYNKSRPYRHGNKVV